jgi:hypothetical protein
VCTGTKVNSSSEKSRAHHVTLRKGCGPEFPKNLGIYWAVLRQCSKTPRRKQAAVAGAIYRHPIKSTAAVSALPRNRIFFGKPGSILFMLNGLVENMDSAVFSIFCGQGVYWWFFLKFFS